MKTIVLFLLIYALINSFPASAQHEHHKMPTQKTPSVKSKKKSVKMNMKGMDINKPKKDTIKAMNDPMVNGDDENKNDATDSMKMNNYDRMSMDTTKSGK
jgi:cytoskeletal protein RodZ